MYTFIFKNFFMSDCNYLISKDMKHEEKSYYVSVSNDGWKLVDPIEKPIIDSCLGTSDLWESYYEKLNTHIKASPFIAGESIESVRKLIYIQMTTKYCDSFDYVTYEEWDKNQPQPDLYEIQGNFESVLQIKQLDGSWVTEGPRGSISTVRQAMRYIEPVLVLHPVIKKRSMFGKDPESRAMQHLIHETNRAMSNIRMTVKDITAELRKHSLI